MNKQEEKYMDKANDLANRKLRQVCQKLLHQSILDLVTDSKSNSLEFKEIRAFMKGLKTGTQFYSEGMVVIRKYLTDDKDIRRLIARLKELNDQKISALIDSIAAPPPEAQKIYLND
jgi:hypothetical protein